MEPLEHLLGVKNMRVRSAVWKGVSPSCLHSTTASPQSRGWAGHSLGGIEYCYNKEGWQDGRHEAQQALHLGSTVSLEKASWDIAEIIWKAY